MLNCLIVGGGVIGLSIAYELAGRGERVRVIDQGQLGKESSWAGAGILPPANAATAIHPLDQLRALSHDLHLAWAHRLREESGIDTGFRRCGGLYLARTVGEAAALHGLKGMLHEEGIEMARLSQSELSQREPGLTNLSERGSLVAAYWLPNESQLRNPDHLRALIACCRQRGVELSEQTEFREFRSMRSRVAEAMTSDGPMAAEKFCVCSGAWTHYLLKQLGFPNGIMPIRGQMMLFKCDQPPFRHILNEGPRYLVPRDDGHVLVGSTEEEVGFVKGTTDESLRELATLARELVPELTPDKVERTWSGLRPGSFDGFPYLGAVPGHDNLFVAAGHFRSGLHLSTGTAVIMSQLMRGEKPAIDLSPFRVGRG